MKYKISFFLLFFCSTVSLKGQDNEIDNQLWLNYTLTVPINQKWSYGGDTGLRGFISNHDWNQVLIRPTVNYRINYNFSVAGAVAWFGTFNREASNINEFRIHQDFNIKWPDFGFLELFYRLRIEQRWFFYETLPNDFNIRVRYLIGAESKDFNFFGPKVPVYFQVIFEGFKTLNDESAVDIFINQTRLHFAFGQRISPRFRYEFHYIRQGSREFVDEGLKISQNIFRIRTYHRLPLKEKN